MISLQYMYSVQASTVHHNFWTSHVVWSRLKSTCHCQVKSSRVGRAQCRPPSTWGHFSLKLGRISLPQRLAGLKQTQTESQSGWNICTHLTVSLLAARLVRAISASKFSMAVRSILSSWISGLTTSHAWNIQHIIIIPQLFENFCSTCEFLRKYFSQFRLPLLRRELLLIVGTQLSDALPVIQLTTWKC